MDVTGLALNDEDPARVRGLDGELFGAVGPLDDAEHEGARLRDRRDDLSGLGWLIAVVVAAHGR